MKKFNDGDILYARDEGQEYVFIFKEIKNNKNIYSYLHLNLSSKSNSDLCLGMIIWLIDYNDTIRFATEEEKERLFDAIKAYGFKWNQDTKTLNELVKPKFKVGDRIKK